MLNEEKLDDIFASFIRTGQQGSDDIKQLYEVLPYLNSDQQRCLTLYRALAVKYNSPVLHSICDSIIKHSKENRSLGFRFTRLIEAFSLFKHFKGYQASSKINNDQGNQT
jgi:hypothetical protein